MFWRKRGQIKENDSELVHLASQLGVEKRQFNRVRLPGINVCKFPEISFAGHALRIHDISIGGCCLLDPSQIMGNSVGHEIELSFRWFAGEERVNARIVSRVDHRRHIQFINLSPSRQSQIKRSMLPGEHGISVRRNLASGEGPSLEAREFWSSVHGDSIVLEYDFDRLAQIMLAENSYTIFRKHRATNSKGQTCSKMEIEQLILFLFNVPNPSQSLNELRQTLELSLREDAR